MGKEKEKDIRENCVWINGTFKQVGYETAKQMCRQCFAKQTETTEYCIHM